MTGCFSFIGWMFVISGVFGLFANPSTGFPCLILGIVIVYNARKEKKRQEEILKLLRKNAGLGK